jgi:hypothetical protein
MATPQDDRIYEAKSRAELSLKFFKTMRDLTGTIDPTHECAFARGYDGAAAKMADFAIKDLELIITALSR